MSEAGGDRNSEGSMSGTARNPIKGEGRGRVGNGGGDPWIKNSVVK